MRVLIANERQDRIALVTRLVVELGHLVFFGSESLASGGAAASGGHPDVALVGLGTSWTYALEVVERLARDAACPVIVMLEGHDAEFIDEAAKRGAFAYVVEGTPQQLRCALDITLRRFAAYHDLQDAFGRRALTERATGILMERYQVDARRASAILREHARERGVQLVAVAQAITDRELLRI